MLELSAIILISAVFGFAVYWHVKFRFLLPLEKKVYLQDTALTNLTNFYKELADYMRIPDSREYLADIFQQAIAKFHKAFPKSIIWLFEEDPVSAVSGGAGNAGRWKLINQAAASEQGVFFISHSVYRSLFLSECVDSAGLHQMEINAFSKVKDDEIVSEIYKHGIRFLLACPCMQGKDGFKGVMLLGEYSRAYPANVKPYMETMCSYISLLHGLSCEFFKLRKETGRLKEELDASMKELSSTGTKLIQRAKERKALYEVVSTITSRSYNPQGGFSAILTILAKIMDADVAACLLLDEDKNELVTQSGAYGIADDESVLYRIPLTNRASSSVRTFLSGKPFITGDAQNDPETIAKYAKAWNINSMIVVPIILHDKAVGVLRVGSAKKDYFTRDQLDFLCLIAEEIAAIIEAMMLYEKLARTAEELSQLNRLKDEFLSTVSHELKTPLTAIRGFVSVLLSGEAGEMTPQQKKFLNIADQAVSRLNHLISDLLDLSRLDGKVEMEFKPVYMENLLKQAVENFMFQAQDKNIELFLRLNGPIVPVHADARWVAQVVDNLLSNAIKFVGGGGKISVWAREKGEAVMICIEDTGPGIAPMDQKYIFDKFYRAKHKSVNLPPGTGLGLAISKAVIEKHGGTIWVESKLGEGSKFFFVFPAAKADAETIKAD